MFINSEHLTILISLPLICNHAMHICLIVLKIIIIYDSQSSLSTILANYVKKLGIVVAIYRNIAR